MRAGRAAGRDVHIAEIVNPRRRRRCTQDPALFLRTYFEPWFFNPFTEDQRAMIAAFVACLEYGGRKAEIADRGGGKTTLIRGLSIYATANGLRQFPVLVGANKDDANHNLATIKGEFEANDLLAEDYPEICYPVRALERVSQRAHAQTVAGRPTDMVWTGDFIRLPTVPGSQASGVMFLSRGIEGAIRGINIGGHRPDLAIIDDPETRQSVRSPTDTAAREATIDADIAGLAGPGRAITIFYLGTIWSANCNAAKYSDPAVKPAWAGRRRKLLKKKPDRTDLWERYIELRAGAVLQGDETGRTAHRFYLDHRAEMDAGAIIGNPYRHDSRVLPDGTEKQASTLQFCFDIIADTSWEHFNTEYQNEPPPEDRQEALELDEAAVMRRINGADRGTVTPEADFLTAGIDVGLRVLHWIIVAWKHAAGAVIDYGATPVHSPLVGRLEDAENVQAVQDAILTALTEFHDIAGVGWPDAATGELRTLSTCMIDAGFARSAMDTPIYAFVRAHPRGLYRASKGFGAGSGQAAYREPGKSGRGRRVYNHAFRTWQPHHRAHLHNLDADYWKTFVHTGLLAPPGQPGALTLFGKDPLTHRHLAKHITAERWAHAYNPKRGDLYFFERVPGKRENHWLDALYEACAAAGILGMKTVGVEPAPPAPPGSPTPRQTPKTSRHRVRLSELQRQKRGSA